MELQLQQQSQQQSQSYSNNDLESKLRIVVSALECIMSADSTNDARMAAYKVLILIFNLYDNNRIYLLYIYSIIFYSIIYVYVRDDTFQTFFGCSGMASLFIFTVLGPKSVFPQIRRVKVFLSNSSAVASLYICIHFSVLFKINDFALI